MFEILPFTSPRDATFAPQEGFAANTIVLAGGAGETLRSDAVEALRSLPRRGLEIGGILLGRAGNSFLISGLRSIESEHLYGPGYKQSERDRTVFEATMEELRRAPAEQPGSEHAPIGLFRTYTREGGTADARDAEAFQRYFARSDAVFLLVAPKLNGRAAVSCCYWDKRSLIPFNFVGVPDVAPAGVQPVAMTRRKAAKAGRWASEVAAAGIAALIVFGAVSLMSHEPSSGGVKAAASLKKSALGVRVEASPEGAEVLWNEKSDAIRQAVGALLSVEDGGNRTDLPLSLSELYTGKVLYGAAGKEARFVLTIYAADGAETKESVVASAPKSARGRYQAKGAGNRGPEKAAREPGEALTLPRPVTGESGSIFPKP
jgi:hypothetical protein